MRLFGCVLVDQDVQGTECRSYVETLISSCIPLQVDVQNTGNKRILLEFLQNYMRSVTPTLKEGEEIFTIPVETGTFENMCDRIEWRYVHAKL